MTHFERQAPGFSLGSERSGRDGLLLLDVLAQDADGRAPAGRRQVAGRPKNAPALGPRMEVAKLLAHHATGDAFEAVHQIRQGDLGRVVDQQVNVIRLPAELHQSRLEVLSHRAQDALQCRHVLLPKNTTAILRHKDQVHVDFKNAVSTLSNVFFVIHRPIIISAVKTLKTLKLRIKDKHAGALALMAREVNQVFNFCNETSRRAIRERCQWLSGYDLQKLTAGFSQCEGVTLGSGTVQLVCAEYATRRRQFKKQRLNWRVSNP
jgi:hypothetical protein